MRRMWSRWWVMTAVLLAIPAIARAQAAPADSSAVPFPTAEERRWQGGLLRADRIQHASFVMTIGLGAGLITKQQGVAAATALGIGLLKELYDMRPGGSGFDALDLTADALGAGAAEFAARRVDDH